VRLKTHVAKKTNAKIKPEVILANVDQVLPKLKIMTEKIFA
jgi:hypothetical protein